MLRFEDIIFGPVHSRRLGSSLGVNLLPPHGKLCNFDCIYCECGWNADGHLDHEMPDTSHVRQAMTESFSLIAEKGEKIDSITFSGNGEPTLNPSFPEIIDVTLEMRDRFFPYAKVSVFSNASTVRDDRIFTALTKVDNPIMKIDAPFTDAVEIINRPCFPYDIDSVVEGLSRFGGDFILQTIFFKGSGVSQTAEAWCRKWQEIVRKLRPREIMAYTLDRETPQRGLLKFTAEEIRQVVAPLQEEGFNIQIRA